MININSIKAFLILASGTLLVSFSPDLRYDSENQDRWTAPSWTDTLTSPFHKEPLTLAQGEELFGLYCASCHGDSGYGDGAAGGALGQKPANFHDTLVTKQSDGALFWKMSNGKGNMPPFQDVFTAEQRWQLVAYIRDLAKKD